MSSGFDSYRRADTDWMRGNFGISVHWTSRTLRQDGSRLSYEDAVDPFYLNDLLDAVQRFFGLALRQKHRLFIAVPHVLRNRTCRPRLVAEAAPTPLDEASVSERSKLAELHDLPEIVDALQAWDYDSLGAVVQCPLHLLVRDIRDPYER